MSKYITLPSLIFSDESISLVESLSSNPNFITSKSLTEEAISIESLSHDNYDNIFGKIVVIENADPGYDWIFSKNISGLITKYGGAASHMAIRCAEFDIPAAIGCGDVLYEKSLKANMVNLDCNNKLISFLWNTLWFYG